jgi:DNA-binding NarL/FixJ family response regulator
MKVRTVLADDNPGFLDAAHRFLDARARRIRIVGEARTGQEAIGLIEVLKPDLLLLDLELPEIGGLDVIRLIKAKAHPPYIIVVTLHDSDAYQAAAAQVGADGFVAKREFTTALMPIIHTLFDEP